MSFEKTFEKFSKDLGSPGIIKLSDSFKLLTTDFQRAAFVLKLNENSSLVSTVDDYSDSLLKVKDSHRSLEMRNAGNEMFKKGLISQALLQYTRSLIFSPPSSSDDTNSMSLAFANRSAALFRLKKYAETILDIDRAIHNGYPQDLLHKLFERKGDSLAAMHQFHDAEMFYKKAISVQKSFPAKQDVFKQIIASLECKLSSLAVSTGSKKIEPLKNIGENQIPSLGKSTNPVLPCLSSACDVVYTESKGRHIVALRDIEPGEIILIEPPFASILVPDQFFTHCNFCMSYTINPIPCDKCVFAVFCSEECRHKAVTAFHKYECSILGLLEISGLDKFSRLAIRTILSVPASKIIESSDNESPKAFNKDRKLTVNEAGTYEWNNYYAICNLVTNAEKRSVSYLFKKSIMALYLLKVIEKTGYLAEIIMNSASKNQLIKLNITALLLSHLQSYPCNAHEISEFQLDDNSVLTSSPAELGAGIYATLSLFNHSCEPVVTRNFYGDICVVRTISPAVAGSEISDNYGTVFQLHSKEYRSQYLSPQYCFECSCQACTNNWPTFAQCMNQPPTWKCDRCSSPLLTKPQDDCVNCPKCHCDQTISAKLSQLLESEKAFKIAYCSLMSCKPKEAIPSICSYLTKLECLVCKPWNDFSKGQETLKQCYSMLANCHTVEHDQT